MVFSFLVGVLLLLGFLAVLRAFAQADVVKLVRGLKWGSVALLGGLSILLVLSGRGGWVLAGVAGIFAPMAIRYFRDNGVPGNDGGSGQRSQVDSVYLRMAVDHGTGVMSGIVLQGTFRGRALSSLGLAELLTLLSECRRDTASESLLEAYLDRTHPDWREAANPQPPPQNHNGAMTREEALEILGLEAGAGPEAVRDAHRRLMLKLHPDHGGSTYLAAKINRAKEILLKT